jgi:hypothetical protein
MRLNWKNKTPRLRESAREEFIPVSKREAKSIPRLLARKTRTLAVGSIDNGEMDDPACEASATRNWQKSTILARMPIDESLCLSSINNSTTQQLNNSTTEQLSPADCLARRNSPAVLFFWSPQESSAILTH